MAKRICGRIWKSILKIIVLSFKNILTWFDAFLSYGSTMKSYKDDDNFKIKRIY